MTIKIMLVCGTRPNFMKIAPVMKAFSKSKHFTTYLVHTGQHYDEKMSNSFFETLCISKPNIDFGVGSGSHAEQTAKIMIEFEKVCLKEKPEMVVVVGDVNSTMACAIVSKKLQIPVAHIEAGLRSGDMSMPEEINRTITDSICDLFFTTEAEGTNNLVRTGIDMSRIHTVGNVMIDTLIQNREISERNSVLREMGLTSKQYCLLTMHRPSNVDDKETLGKWIDIINQVQDLIKVVFPIHPRTLGMVIKFGFHNILRKMPNVKLCDPLDYHKTLKLNAHSRFVITDSGGLQEETTALGIPCLTIRENTERPVTVSIGTNEVVGRSEVKILTCVDKILSGKWKKGRVPSGWDGKASERIVSVMENYFKIGLNLN